MPSRATLFLLLLCAAPPAAPALAADAPPALPQTLWLEAETFGPLKGANFSYQPVERTTKGSWSVAGPGTAAEWTQGGESGWMSIAARADEPGELAVGRDAEVPAGGEYALWVRYADYRGKNELFGVRVTQGGRTVSHLFGRAPIVDELDSMKLLWGWCFAWDHAAVSLQKGPARVEIFIPGPSEARRQVDCVCLTTDRSYQPTGREQPDRAAWKVLREIERQAHEGGPGGAGTVWGGRATEPPAAWKTDATPPAFLWNVGQPWMDELKPPATQPAARPATAPAAARVTAPFNVDPPLLKDFLAAVRGKDVAVYGDALSGPAVHVPMMPAAFAPGGPLPAWLDAHPGQRFGILLNYGEPAWPKGKGAAADRAAVAAAVDRYADRFVGYVAGENLSYAEPDQKALEAKVRAAKSRGEVLAALREAYTAATVKKFSDYGGAPLSPERAWGPVVSCLSANVETYAHALPNWGAKRVGHENTGNAPTLARRLAFLRGAARQFGARIVDYQSCNLGDASTIFSRESFFYPASSKYILDNQYDAWAGSGLNWVLKDYLLFHLAGADAFYHEEGTDLFWKPGGNSAGDSFPVELSPRGRVTEAVMKLAGRHPRGVQLTPIAFLLDAAHGWSQERYTPGAFGLDPLLNPAVLTPGKHEAAIRGWFDVAYFPAPETQNEPASAIRQTYVNGIFGDVFDVIVTAPGRSAAASAYPVLIAAGDVPLTEAWGEALRDYMEAGGTLVACAGSLGGPGAARVSFPDSGEMSEADSFEWKAAGEAGAAKDGATGPATGPAGGSVASNVFRYRPMTAAPGDRVLAAAPGGGVIALERPRGKGRLIAVSVPLGLGVDDAPVPLLALLTRDLARNAVPVRVAGDVEWAVNRLDDGGLLVALLNNSGVLKPQHGVLWTDHRESRRVTLTLPFPAGRSAEWVTETDVAWGENGGTSATLTVPAGAVRLVAVYPRR